MPFGFGVAASVRVGNALGAGNAEQARRSCTTVLLCAGELSLWCPCWIWCNVCASTARYLRWINLQRTKFISHRIWGWSNPRSRHHQAWLSSEICPQPSASKIFSATPLPPTPPPQSGPFRKHLSLAWQHGPHDSVTSLLHSEWNFTLSTRGAKTFKLYSSCSEGFDSG